jgi:hypothetical protein
MTILNDQQFNEEFAAMMAGKDSKLGTVKETPAPAPAPAAAPVVDPPAAEPAAAAPVVDPPAAEPAVEPAKNEPDPAAATPQAADPAKEKPADQPAQEPAKTAEQVAAEAAAASNLEPDYKAAYQRIFGGPIRAGGKDITIANVDEAVSLIQKGVGFHSKMNKVQGDVAIAETLRQAGIDQPTLNLLIDAHLKKPGAIKKLLDSAKLDPLTLDSAEASTYAPSEHRVTQAQVQFNSVVEDLTETTHGSVILQDANRWDQSSKAEIYKNPALLTELAHQKEIGLYDRIKGAVERERLMGNVPMTEPFLVSYTRVGAQMRQAGALSTGTPAPTPTPTPVAQKVITPAAPVNQKQAAAAAPTRQSPPAKTPVADPLKNLSDAEFETQFKRTYKI